MAEMFIIGSRDGRGGEVSHDDKRKRQEAEERHCLTSTKTKAILASQGLVCILYTYISMMY
jgi:hypothetical protein